MAKVQAQWGPSQQKKWLLAGIKLSLEVLSRATSGSKDAGITCFFAQPAHQLRQCHPRWHCGWPKTPLQAAARRMNSATHVSLQKLGCLLTKAPFIH